MAKIPPKGSRRSRKRLKSSTPSAYHVEISDSSSDECPESTSFLKKPSSSVLDKDKTDSSVSFDLDDMQKFWNVFEKEKIISFKDRPFSHGQVIYLEHLEEFHCS
ncbi:hypothetical protein HAX54_006954, partial [Datura stramonium]|nr:hypothetical protein [Datura stramonium]